MLAGTHRLDALARMHLRGRRQDHGLDAGLHQGLGIIRSPVRNLEFLGDLLG